MSEQEEAEKKLLAEEQKKQEISNKIKKAQLKLKQQEENKKLLEQGLCTQADIDSKAYMMFESEIVVTETTALDKMQKLITEFGLTKAQAGKVLEKCDF